MTFWKCMLLVSLQAILVNGLGGKSCSSLSDEEYNIIVSLVKGQKLQIPVRERTTLQNNAITKFYRNKKRYSLRGDRDPEMLFFDNKLVVKKSECAKIIRSVYHEMKGIGARRLFHSLKHRYRGLSEDVISKHLSQNILHQRLHPRFTNKAPMKTVTSKRVHDVLQIDLIDLSSMKVSYGGHVYRYVMSVIDVFSRMVWLRPLRNKSSFAVKQHLSDIFTSYGIPRVVQHDCGKEFDGYVKNFLQNKKVRQIRSRPYHPQSQGKIERMHRLLKKQISFDLIKMKRIGINWAKHLPIYQKQINETPKECLSWRTPFQVYFGRDSYDNDSEEPSPSVGRWLNKVRNTRNAAERATRHCAKRDITARNKKLKTPVYFVGERVLIKYKVKKHKVPKRIFALPGVVVKRRIANHMYKILFKPPQSDVSQENWYHVSNITAATQKTQKNKENNVSKQKLHHSQFYIPLTRKDRNQQFMSDFGLGIDHSPDGDGNCQFNAVAHQLTNIGIYRSAETLREEVISYLVNNDCLGSNGNDVPWNLSLEENRMDYLNRMARNFEYGDQLTLQAISEIYNVQIVVVSTLNQGTTLISPDGACIFRREFPVLILGHYPEGEGEHYVSLKYDWDKLEKIIQESNQINPEPDLDDERHLFNNDVVNDFTFENTHEERVRRNREEGNIPDIADVEQEEIEENEPSSEDYIQKLPEILDLPLEILSLIIMFCLKDDLTMQDTLRNTHPKLASAVEIALKDINIPKFYLSDWIQHKLKISELEDVDISVNKLIRVAGKGSGLADEIRKIVTHPRWYNAWLKIRRTNVRPGWFFVTDIFWRT